MNRRSDKMFGKHEIFNKPYSYLSQAHIHFPYVCNAKVFEIKMQENKKNEKKQIA